MGKFGSRYNWDELKRRYMDAPHGTHWKFLSSVHSGDPSLPSYHQLKKVVNEERWEDEKELAFRWDGDASNVEEGLAVLSQNTRKVRYQSSLPEQYREFFLGEARDTNILNLKPEIALLSTRINDLLHRLGTGESGKSWLDLKDACIRLKQAKAQNDAGAIAHELNVVLAIVQLGSDDVHIWNEITPTIEFKKRLVDSEQKRVLAMQEFISRKEVESQVGMILDAVSLEVQPQTLAKIKMRIMEMRKANPQLVSVG